LVSSVAGGATVLNSFGDPYAARSTPTGGNFVGCF
jgi:hypothetical protein